MESKFIFLDNLTQNQILSIDVWNPNKNWDNSNLFLEPDLKVLHKSKEPLKTSDQGWVGTNLNPGI